MYRLWRFSSFLTGIVNRLIASALALSILQSWYLSTRGTEVPASEYWLEIGSNWLSEHSNVGYGAAIVVLALNLNLVQFLLFSLVNRPGKAFIESKTPGGQSRIALSAIEAALDSTARQVPEISRSRIRVLKLGAHRYRVHIRYHVTNVAEAGNAAEHLRLVLKKRFSDLVVLDPKDRVEFDLDLAGIDGLRGAVPARRELAKPEAGARDPGFKGPIYPVDGDS